MDRANPSFILRNYLLEEAIREAENNDFTMVKELLRMARQPYEQIAEHR
jgi:serine/tyrosine/threonine adenylyltransferase